MLYARITGASFGNNCAMQTKNKRINSISNTPCQDLSIDDTATLLSSVAFANERKDAGQIVIVCFGTNAISGDALGPMVGTLLTQKYNVSAFVYGTEESNVNGKNMGIWLDFIKEVHKGALFIAVDASVGAKTKIGQIVIREDGVCPAGVTGKKARFGDVGVLGIVAQSGGDSLIRLMCASPLEVSEMADKISIMLKQTFF